MKTDQNHQPTTKFILLLAELREQCAPSRSFWARLDRWPRSWAKKFPSMQFMQFCSAQEKKVMFSGDQSAPLRTSEL